MLQCKCILRWWCGLRWYRHLSYWHNAFFVIYIVYNSYSTFAPLLCIVFMLSAHFRGLLYFVFFCSCSTKTKIHYTSVRAVFCPRVKLYYIYLKWASCPIIILIRSRSPINDFAGHYTKTGKRSVATATVGTLQGSWSGGRRGNVPPKSDWSAVVYQQLAACLARPVIKYCWSSSGKKILFTDKYRPKFQIRSHDLRFEIDTYNFPPTFLLYYYRQLIHLHILYI